MIDPFFEALLQHADHIVSGIGEQPAITPYAIQTDRIYCRLRLCRTEVIHELFRTDEGRAEDANAIRALQTTRRASKFDQSRARPPPGNHPVRHRG